VLLLHGLVFRVHSLLDFLDPTAQLLEQSVNMGFLTVKDILRAVFLRLAQVELEIFFHEQVLVKTVTVQFAKVDHFLDPF